MALATAERLSRGRLSDEILSSKIIDEVPLHAMTTYYKRRRRAVQCRMTSSLKLYLLGFYQKYEYK